MKAEGGGGALYSLWPSIGFHEVSLHKLYGVLRVGGEVAQVLHLGGVLQAADGAPHSEPLLLELLADPGAQVARGARNEDH